MKIKKVSSLLSPLAKVLNIKSNSTEDTYSCDYINKLNNYSEEEQVVGTWSGKPLYRIITTIPANILVAGEKFYDFSQELQNIFNDLENFVNINAVYRTATTPVFWGNIPRIHNSESAWYLGIYQVRKGGVLLYTGSKTLTLLNSITITLEYTKTTD